MASATNYLPPYMCRQIDLLLADEEPSKDYIKGPNETVIVCVTSSQMNMEEFLLHEANIIFDLDPAFSSRFLPQLGETKSGPSYCITCTSEMDSRTHRHLHHECFFPSIDKTVAIDQFIPVNINSMDLTPFAGQKITILTPKDHFRTSISSYKKFLAALFFKLILADSPYRSFEQLFLTALNHLAQQGVALDYHEKAEIKKSCLEMLRPSDHHLLPPTIRHIDKEAVSYSQLMRQLVVLENKGKIAQSREELFSKIAPLGQFWGIYPEGGSCKFIQRIPGSAAYEEITLAIDSTLIKNLQTLTGKEHRLELLREKMVLFDNCLSAFQFLPIPPPYRLWPVRENLLNLHLNNGIDLPILTEEANFYTVIEQLLQG